MTEEEVQKLLIRAVRDYPYRPDLLEKIIRYYYPKVQRLVGLYIRDPFNIDDITQDVFGRFIRKLPDLQPERGSCKAYLYKITLNEIRRNKRNTQRVDYRPPENLDIKDPRKEEMELIEIREVLSQMQARYSDILKLYYFENMKVSEISEILDMKESAVKMRLNRAREQFARLWNRDG